MIEPDAPDAQLPMNEPDELTPEIGDDPENIDPADLDVEVAPFPGDEPGEDYDQDDDDVDVPLDVDEL